MRKKEDDGYLEATEFCAAVRGPARPIHTCKSKTRTFANYSRITCALEIHVHVSSHRKQSMHATQLASRMDSNIKGRVSQKINLGQNSGF
jgi:hypothetical protein